MSRLRTAITSVLLTFTFVSYAVEEVVDRNRLTILTPSLASRKTAKLRLDNGLEVLLISDGGASQSAASLAMEVGSWDDLPAHPGIAHFTEHLLFMGSKTYPEEKGYFKAISQGKGKANAFTASDRTVYTFAVNHDAFTGVLNRFSRMFIDPLFNPEGIDREMHAVDQECDRAMRCDATRSRMVLKAIGNEKHPGTRFSIGNRETLRNISRDTVIDWYETHYGAEKGHLVLYSPLPLATLKELTVSLFSPIAQSRVPRKIPSEPFFNSSEEGCSIVMNSLVNENILTLSWELPSRFFLNIEEGSMQTLSYLLNSRHEGSLYDILRKKHLIHTIDAAPIPLAKESGGYGVTFDMTEEGAARREEIVTAFFRTINGLRHTSLPDYLFDEIKTIDRIEYEYQSRENPFHFVENTAYHMAEESLDTFPQKLTVRALLDKDAYADLLDQLTPEKALYLWRRPPGSIDDASRIPEKWSGAEYGRTPRNEELLVARKGVLPGPGETPYPEKNPFIPRNLRLVLPEPRVDPERATTPRLLVDDKLGKTYYYPDLLFRVPEVALIISFKSPLIDNTPKQWALHDLFIRCLRDRLRKQAYYAGQARLSVSMKAEEYACTLRINGFSEMALPLLREVLAEMGKGYFSKELFEGEKRHLIAQYKNVANRSVQEQAHVLGRNILFGKPMPEECAAVLGTITYEEFLVFRKALFAMCYTNMILSGNLTEEDARQVHDLVRRSTGSLPYAKHLRKSAQLFAPPEKKGPYRIHKPLDIPGHTALLALYEGPFSFEQEAIGRILATKFSEDFFNTLRTRQQTGYAVYSEYLDDGNLLLHLFGTQSTTHEPAELISRFELFLEGYVKEFARKIDEEQFDLIRRGLITRLRAPHDNLQKATEEAFTRAF
ncbi:MAG: insulinase family protein, partial [Simkaniaceae bacterium]|nr:insulinase family protein [Simkaniaceae bacterium]